jgi:hypothetical protein
MEDLLGEKKETRYCIGRGEIDTIAFVRRGAFLGINGRSIGSWSKNINIHGYSCGHEYTILCHVQRQMQNQSTRPRLDVSPSCLVMEVLTASSLTREGNPRMPGELTIKHAPEIIQGSRGLRKQINGRPFGSLHVSTFSRFELWTS